MSYRSDKKMSLAGVNYSSLTKDEIHEMFNSVLKSGMHGICFSLYEDGQRPGSLITEEQVRRRMEIIKPYTKWVRSFSSTDGNELVPMIAKEYGLKTLVGAWLGKDAQVNERELKGLINLANEGYVDIAAVGNEVMYRNEISEEELLNYISGVKKEITDIPVGYVDAYYEFSTRPRITALCDVVLDKCCPC